MKCKKKGHKIRHSRVVTCLMTATTHGHNSGLNYGHESRTSCNRIHNLIKRKFRANSGLKGWSAFGSSYLAIKEAYFVHCCLKTEISEDESCSSSSSFKTQPLGGPYPLFIKYLAAALPLAMLPAGETWSVVTESPKCNKTWAFSMHWRGGGFLAWKETRLSIWRLLNGRSC